MNKYWILYWIGVALGSFSCNEEGTTGVDTEIDCPEYCSSSTDFACENGECQCQRESGVIVNQAFCAYPGTYLATTNDWHCVDTFGLVSNMDLERLLGSDVPEEGVALGGILHERARAQTSFPYVSDGNEVVFEISVPVNKDTEFIGQDEYYCFPAVADGAECRLYLEGRATHPDTIQALLRMRCEGGFRDSTGFQMVVVR